MSGEKFVFGERVRITRALKRVSEYRTKRQGSLGWEREAEWRVWRAYWLPEPIEGIVVGTRVLMDTERVYLGYEEGWDNDLANAKRFPAVLVAYDLRKKSVFVFPEDVQRV